jgi:hypothetical protein
MLQNNSYAAPKAKRPNRENEYNNSDIYRSATLLFVLLGSLGQSVVVVGDSEHYSLRFGIVPLYDRIPVSDPSVRANPFALVRGVAMSTKQRLRDDTRGVRPQYQGTPRKAVVLHELPGILFRALAR